MAASGRTGGRGSTSGNDEGADIPRSFPTVPAPTPMVDHSFTLQAVMEVQKTLASPETKVDRVLQDRKDDRSELRNDMKEFKTSFDKFVTDDFKTLSVDVQKLKISWAKVLGGAAVAGAVVSFLVDVVKDKLGH